MNFRSFLVGLWVLVNLAYANLWLPRLPPSVFLFFLSMWLPAITALIFTFLEGISLKEALNLREGSIQSYGLAVMFPLLVAAFTAAYGIGAHHLHYNSDFKIFPQHFIPTLFIWMVAALGEEVGWRGYLHNHLRAKSHAPLFIGLIWGAWHFRQLIHEHYSASLIASFLAITVFASYFLSWLIESGGSVFSCAVFHGLWDFLRLRIFFKSSHAHLPPLFVSDRPRLTDMQGPYGLLFVALLAIPFVILWYRRGRLTLKA